ncbi:MAG: hypothetical protein QM768_12495 [Agriterribacter sp.]
MNYELSELEILIQRIVANQKEENQNFMQQDILHEVKHIKSVWRNIACSEHDTGFLKNYVRQHQLGLISLGEIVAPDNTFAPLVYTTLEELHLFLLQSFPSFIDLSLTIDDHSLALLKASWQTALPVFESKCRTLKIPDILIACLFRPIRFWLSAPPGQPIRYYRLQFFVQLQAVIMEFIDQKNPPLKITGILIDRLCHINFNSLVVYEVIKQLISEKAVAKDDLMEEIEFLHSMHEHFKRLPIRTDVFYKPDGRVMARCLADWLHRQVKAKEAQHHALFIEETPVTEEEMAEAGKIMTTLSIEELALIIRLFIETAVFKVKRNALTGLTRFMARNVRTVSKGVYDEYKPETLYKYVYSISLVTLRSVQNILKRMLRKLDAIETLIKSGKPVPPPNRK